MKTISSSGLLGLVMKIDEELKNGKSKDEVLSEYPVSKTALPFLLTLLRECSLIISGIAKDYGELESKNNTLKEQIKLLESEKGFCNALDTKNLENELKTLKNENNELSKHITRLKRENTQLEDKFMDLENEFIDLQSDFNECSLELSRLNSFFDNSWLCSFFLRIYSQKMLDVHK